MYICMYVLCVTSTHVASVTCAGMHVYMYERILPRRDELNANRHANHRARCAKERKRGTERKQERKRDKKRLVNLCSFYYEYFDSLGDHDLGMCYHLLLLSSSSMSTLERTTNEREFFPHKLF